MYFKSNPNPIFVMQTTLSYNLLHYTKWEKKHTYCLCTNNAQVEKER